MKGRKERSSGGRDDAAEDVKDKPEMRVNATKEKDEAEERRKGGRAKRRRGGVVHHENMDHMKHAKHLGPVRGEPARQHAGRKPRASGGKTGSDSHPFSSARKGELPAGRKEMYLE
jgi:hypothetical protein